MTWLSILGGTYLRLTGHYRQSRYFGVCYGLLHSLLRYDGSELSDVEIWQPGLLPGID